MFKRFDLGQLDTVAEKAARGDKKSINLLSEMLVPMIFTVAINSQSPPIAGYTVEDLVSEGAITVIEKASLYDPERSRAGWFFKTCVENRFIDIRRHQTRKCRVPVGDLGGTDDLYEFIEDEETRGTETKQEHEGRLTDIVLGGQIAERVKAISQEAYTAFQLFADGETWEEIAQTLGWTRVDVRRVIRQVRTRIEMSGLCKESA